MFNRKSIYLFLLSATVCSIFFKGAFLIVAGLSFLTVLFMNRGLFYTLRANKAITDKNMEKGYRLLTKAYKTGGVPHVVVNGFIYISIKYGYLEEAKEAIDKVLSGKVYYKLKDTQKNMIKTQDAVWHWCSGDINKAIEILDNLYEEGYRTTTFYGNYGCLLYINKNYEKAEKVCLEAYDFGSTDKVTLDNLVALYIAIKDWDKAEKYYAELLTLSPTFAEAWYHGAMIAFNKNNKVEALELLDKAESYELFKISSITKDDLETLRGKIEA